MTSSLLIRASPFLAILLLGDPANAKARHADYNGDGRADLAIGVPFELVNGAPLAGGVSVLYGKKNSGLTSAGDQFWTQESSGVQGIAEEEDLFGIALAHGDFDDDGFSDLAIGVPGDTVNGVLHAGSVCVLYGSSQGLKATRDLLLHRDVDDVEGDLQTVANLGIALAAGDFDGDGYDDLAVGVPWQNVGAVNRAGEALIVYGGPSGLTGAGSQVFNQDTGGIDEDPEEVDFFAYGLSAGDFDGNDRDDLAISVWNESIGGYARAGAVHVLYGSGVGLTTTGAQFITQDAGAIEDAAEATDFFGQRLASGDFDDNGSDDLAVSVPGEDLDDVGDVGAVHVLYGSSAGLDTDEDDFWHQGLQGIADSFQENDHLGTAMAAGDFDDDGRDDLVIGVSQEDFNGKNDPGAVHVLYGSNNGLSLSSNELWHQDSPGIRDTAQNNDTFGAGLAAGDFDDNGVDDLVVAAVDESINGVDFTGAVNIIYGKRNSGLHHESNQFFHQNTDGINDSCATLEKFGMALQ